MSIVHLGYAPYKANKTNDSAEQQMLCAIFMAQLERQFGHPPILTNYLMLPGKELHTYEVVLSYSNALEESRNYANLVRDDRPKYWDDEAIINMEKGGITRVYKPLKLVNA